MSGMRDYKNFNILNDGSSPSYSYRYPEASSSSKTGNYGANNEFLLTDGARAESPHFIHYTEGEDVSAHRRRDLNLSFNSETIGLSSQESSPDDVASRKYADKGVGLISIFADNILSHPFIVLRRQCQVHVQSRRYHLSPFTLIYPVFHICQRQGCSVLWKGLGSSLIVKGMTMFVEDLTSKVSPLPGEVTRHSSLKSVFHHILLKAISLAVITPFYSASLVETAQSEVASESCGFFDVFREGLWRIVSWSGSSTGRLIPLHSLIIPTVAHGLVAYLIYTGIRSVSLSTIRRVRETKGRNKGPLSIEPSISYSTELTASLIGHATADIILFPIETILNRLHLQGTRTIIDSLDCGIEVTPIITSYGGFSDCFRTTVEEEGFSGLYKGFGALVLQYGLQILLIRLLKIGLDNSPFGAPQVPPLVSTSPLSKNGGGASKRELLINSSQSEGSLHTKGAEGEDGSQAAQRPRSRQSFYGNISLGPEGYGVSETRYLSRFT